MEEKGRGVGRRKMGKQKNDRQRGTRKETQEVGKAAERGRKTKELELGGSDGPCSSLPRCKSTNCPKHQLSCGHPDTLM